MNQCPRCLKQFRTVFGDAEMQEIVHTCTPTKEWREMEEATEKSSKEIERLNALVAMQAEALKLAIEYWNHRQQRYKNRHPVWVQEARAILSASSSTIAKWEAAHAAEVLEEAADRIERAKGQSENEWGDGYTAASKDHAQGLRSMSAELRTANKKEGE